MRFDSKKKRTLTKCTFNINLTVVFGVFRELISQITSVSITAIPQHYQQTRGNSRARDQFSLGCQKRVAIQ